MRSLRSHMIVAREGERCLCSGNWRHSAVHAERWPRLRGGGWLAGGWGLGSGVGIGVGGLDNRLTQSAYNAWRPSSQQFAMHKESCGTCTTALCCRLDQRRSVWTQALYCSFQSVVPKPLLQWNVEQLAIPANMFNHTSTRIAILLHNRHLI